MGGGALPGPRGGRDSERRRDRPAAVPPQPVGRWCAHHRPSLLVVLVFALSLMAWMILDDLGWMAEKRHAENRDLEWLSVLGRELEIDPLDASQLDELCSYLPHETGTMGALQDRAHASCKSILVGFGGALGRQDILLGTL